MDSLSLGRAVLKVTAGVHRCKPGATVGKEAIAVPQCDRAVLPESRCGLVLSIHTVRKYFSWCREELPAPLLQRNGSLVLLSRPALLLSAFSVSLGMERGVCGEGSCLCRRKQGACEAFFRAWFGITF